jgi:ABC-2 type transport system ATP-binding protein
MSDYVVFIQNLYKKFQQKTALSDFNLTVGAGEIHALAGPPGAGKTTILNILAGTVQPGTGFVRIFDMPAGSLEIKKAIGYVPAKPAFYRGLSVLDYLVFMGMVSGLTQIEVISRAVSLLKRIELNAFRDKKPTDFPAGMKTKIAIAQSLLNRPSLWLLDEPVSGTDQAGKEGILQIIRELAAEEGITVLLSAAKWTDVAGIADHMTILQGGRSVLSDSTANIADFAAQGVFTIQTSNNELLLEILRRMTYLSSIVRSERDIITVITKSVERFQKDLPGILYKLQLELLYFQLEEVNMENISQYLLRKEGDQ